MVEVVERSEDVPIRMSRFTRPFLRAWRDGLVEKWEDVGFVRRMLRGVVAVMVWRRGNIVVRGRYVAIAGVRIANRRCMFACGGDVNDATPVVSLVWW